MKFFPTFILVLLSFTSFSQLSYQSLSQWKENAINSPAKTSSGFMLNDTIQLPFFDDFSLYTGAPDSSLWEQGSGAFVSTGLAISPPSAGVVSLDGLNEFGRPYDFRDNFPKGTADILTSRPIDLSALTVNENLYLSFFWQQGGFGEVPDAKQGDSLVLEFKARINDSTYLWKNIWAVQASDSLPIDTIIFEILPLEDTSYFYETFQFRFRNRGTLSGNYDNWHLDYIFLNSNRFREDSSFLDRTMIKSDGRIFKDFTAIPSNHIHADSLFFMLKDTNTASVRTLSRLFSTYRIRTIFRDDSSGAVVQNFTSPIAQIINGYLSTEAQVYPISQNAVENFSFNPNQKYYFSQSFLLFDHGDTITDGVDRRVNDTATYRGALDNYYAYDDGEPELGVGIRTPFGKVAVEYVPYKKDTLTALDIMFIPAERSISSTEIGIRIWSGLERDIDPVIYGQNIIGAYGPERNSFFRVQFDSAVIIEDTVYIGWVQFDKTFLNVGYDMNNVFNDKIFTKVDPSEGWVNEGDFEFPGAIMIRPVFDTVSAPIAEGSFNRETDENTEPEERYEVVISPNPSTGLVQIDSECDSYFVYDLNGREILSGEAVNSEESIDLRQLPNGSYVITFVKNGESSRKRLLIFK